MLNRTDVHTSNFGNAGFIEFVDSAQLLDFMGLLGSVPSDEGLPMSELEHGLQCAAQLLRHEPHDEALQIAGLVHDVAHIWDEPGQPRHALIGADAVRKLLGERVARLVAGHVPAKRWLVTCDPSYRARLSPGSIQTLAAQGGVMSREERIHFESLRDWQAMVALRRADDAAKVTGASVPGLETWADAIQRIVARNC